LPDGSNAIFRVGFDKMQSNFNHVLSAVNLLNRRDTIMATLSKYYPDCVVIYITTILPHLAYHRQKVSKYILNEFK